VSSHTTPASSRRGRRWLSRRAAVVAVAGLAATGAAGAAIVADAAVPAFPNNVVVFPDRDFVTIEGYQDAEHLGKEALVEVKRDGKVIGSAKGVVEEGDVAFEINHPGGYCWGAGTGVNVTPDIRPRDVVSISFDNGATSAGETTVGDAYVTHGSELGTTTVTGDTLTVHGYAAPGVNHAQMEQRIIAPDLVPTEVGRRDIRAVEGTTLTPSDKGGYASNLAFSGNEWTATYVFENAATAAIAAKAGGERAMSWQVEDADANRQGLTIAEFGEAGGPGMGGCPAGPGDVGTPQPGGAAVTRSADNTSMSVEWNASEALPGAAPVTGYSVEAVSKTATENQRAVIGKRTLPGARQTVLTGLDAKEGYNVEVRAMADGKMSDAFTVQAPSSDPVADGIAPVLNATPDDTAPINIASEVKLSSEAGADIYYTLDGTAAVAGGMPTAKAMLYTAPIAVNKKVTLHAVAFDAAGNYDTFTAVYDAPADTNPAPSAVTNVTGTAGPSSVTLSWVAPEPNITGFGVQVYTGAPAAGGVKVGALRETTAKTLTIPGLAEGADYWFTVQAKNATGYGPASTPFGPLTVTKAPDVVTITTARWKVGDFRVSGTDTLPGAILTVREAPANGIYDKTKPSLGQAQAVAVALPGTGATYDVRMRNNQAPAVKPTRVFVESSGGGVAGPFTVANG
jgi:Fn3 domain-containing protein/fibronectin type III domain protein